MVREAELEEMEKKWREENERIMQLHPPKSPLFPEPGQPDEMPPLANPDSPEEELPPEKRPLP
jgi:sec-independent protein translocase protein TatB